MRYTFKSNCSCNDKEFTIVYYSENGESDEFYCPFCGILIEEIEQEDEDYLEDE